MDDFSRFTQHVAEIGSRQERLDASFGGEFPTTKIAAHIERIAQGANELKAFAANYNTENMPSSESVAGEFRHDVRNLINTIAGPCQLVARKLDDVPQLDCALKLKEAYESLLAFIDDFDIPNSDSSSQALNSTSSAPTEAATILVAEDNIDNQRTLQELLSDQGHTVEFAATGRQAIDRAEQGSFDLLLLDLGLPEMSGFEVLEHLQSTGWQIPTIVITGRSGVEDAVRCIEHGADDFLTKPIQVELLRARVNSCVEKMRLREREFGQFFPPNLARLFARRPSLVNDLPSKHAEVSILFCDIRGFTSISERLGPDKTTRWLRAVMNELSDTIIANEGVLVDFAGDEIMAMWGAPDEIEDHAERACRTAVQILEKLPAISEQWAQDIEGDTDLAIGISSGQAMVGHVGTTRKIKYGPLGATVNLSSRCLGATKYLKSRLLITDATRNALGSKWRGGDIRRLSKVRLHHVENPVELYEVRPLSNDRSAELDGRYESALKFFESNALQQAAAVLGQILVDDPDDGPSLMLMSRVVEAMLSNELNFDPIWTLAGK